ncbi:MAG TPA: aspartate-semialdehyde dehydrogenase [Spirochaetaceae bacterium]|nr:aspartate-semialdehyde dehydrogenase [Spirochaetaceae bacterium]
MVKIPVAILGATGAVGQRLALILAEHPWFEPVYLGASERSEGRPYGDAARWILPDELPARLAGLRVGSVYPEGAREAGLAGGAFPRLAFSALDAAAAAPAEEAWAQAGVLVVSNASVNRMRTDVPLVIPEINPGHLSLLAQQSYPRGGGIVTNPNCSTIGLAMALKPLHDSFGIEACSVTTLQAASGAGYPGVPSLDILDNAIPFIGGEEAKLESEPAKILGSYQGDDKGGSIREAGLSISAACHRVAVRDGHLEAVALRCARVVSRDEILAAWAAFDGGLGALGLPWAPLRPLVYIEAEDRPQPRLDRERERGMAVSLGRLRPCPVLGWKFELLSHNTLRGAAGGTVLLAELCAARGIVA